MWEYEVITIDYDAQKLADNLKGHPGIAAVLSSYASRNWEVVTAVMLVGVSGPMFILRRQTDANTSTGERSRTDKR